MKIMHILGSSSFSGAENVVCQIVEMLGEEKIEFVYVSRDGQIRKSLAERGIRFVAIERLSVLEVKRVLREETPDLIHAHDMRASFFAALVCGGIPLVSHIHNNNFDSRHISIKTILYWYAAKKARHIFWVSKSSFEGYFFHRGLEEKSEILYNIISVDALKEKMRLDHKQYDYEVVFLGRLTFQKNPERLLRVFTKIAQIRPSTKMAIVGNGELAKEVQNHIKKARLVNHIFYLGFMENPYKLLYDAKVMLMTSRWEGTPICALEAMSLGVPVVCTPTDGLAELVKDGKTGYLSNQDDELAVKTCKLLEDRQLQKAMSQKSVQRIDELVDAESYKESILKAYEY